jgi:hypothetical protein
MIESNKRKMQIHFFMLNKDIDVNEHGTIQH